MNLENECLPIFYGHQSFHPRFGWLKKAFDATIADSQVFTRPDAPVTLGVGKNMVEAIRFWATAYGVITRIDPEKYAGYTPTQFAHGMFSENGLDPYLEDISSLWILHWRSLSPKSSLPIWWIAFNDFQPLEFTEAELEGAVISSIEASTFKTPSLMSIQRDIDCFLRMFSVKQGSKRSTWEDQLDSPFRQLRLISPALGKANAYRFKSPGVDSVPEVAVIVACLEFADRILGGAKVISLSRLVLDAGSPGQVLRISQDEIVQAIDSYFGSDGEVKIASAAGALMLAIEGNPIQIAQQVLISHHATRGVRKRTRKNQAFFGPNSYLPSVEIMESSGLFAFAEGDTDE